MDALPEQFFTGILAESARAAKAPGAPFISLGRGNPDLPPPPHAIEALQAAAAQTATPAVHGYPPFGGHADLRVAIAQVIAPTTASSSTPSAKIAVIPGTKTGIMLACMATAGDGDAILLPDPGYPDYLSGAALAGARVVALPLRAANGFQPDFEEAGAAVASPALTVLNYPSNPTGAVEAPGTFEAAVAFAHERGAWLLNDMAYGFLAFDGHRARSILKVDGARHV